jgi:hypothetical protein
MNRYTLAGATTLGRDHAALRRNAQDAFALGESGSVAYGIVCDGCGSGGRSEVGAHLSAALLSASFDRLLDEDILLTSIPDVAVSELVAQFAALAGAMGENGQGARFVTHHLLATTLGFCLRGDEGVLFWCGDGWLVLDGDAVRLEAEYPDYPAYRLFGRETPVNTRLFDAGAVERIAVATDGFDEAALADAFGRSPLALQRWMNVQLQNGHFSDDATIVTAERARR